LTGAFASTVDLSRPGADRPADNGFKVTGAHADLSLLKEALQDHLPDFLARIRPQTNDPTIRNVQWHVNQLNTTLSYETKKLFFWADVEIASTATIQPARCADSSRSGYDVVLTVNDNRFNMKDYVQNIRVQICARPSGTEKTNVLDVQVKRLIDTGPQYQPWIGLLLGDFMRSSANALQQELLTLSQ
jgi:hypothetical protein